MEYINNLQNFLEMDGLIFIDGQTTVSNISQYADIRIETIKTMIKRNRTLFKEYGVRVIHNPNATLYNINPKSRLLTLLSCKSAAYIILNCTKTNEKRNALIEKYPTILNSLSVNFTEMYVKKYEKELSFLINGVFGFSHNIEEQRRIGNYVIDFLIDNKIAIECDEYGHEYYDKTREVDREKYIVDNGYKILRYDTRDNNMLKFIGIISDSL